MYGRKIETEFILFFIFLPVMPKSSLHRIKCYGNLFLPVAKPIPMHKPNLNGAGCSIYIPAA